MNLKRDNWSNEEVMNILQGLLITSNLDLDSDEFIPDDCDWNTAITTAITAFAEFVEDEKKFGAKAYCTDDGRVYHIGEIPKEDSPTICKNCEQVLDNNNYDGNGARLCNPCYDKEYDGCYGSGCR